MVNSGLAFLSLGSATIDGERWEKDACKHWDSSQTFLTLRILQRALTVGGQPAWLLLPLPQPCSMDLCV